jgi:sec-independent protein translocase protein TatA
MTTLHVLAFQIPSMGEWIVIAAIGLLFFGKRLPEVGRSLGKGIVEFKKGLKGIEDEVETASSQPTRTALPTQDEQAKAALPGDAKFDPYTGKPVEAKFDPYTGKPVNGESTTTVTSGAPQENVAHS